VATLLFNSAPMLEAHFPGAAILRSLGMAGAWIRTIAYGVPSGVVWDQDGEIKLVDPASTITFNAD